MCTRKEIVGDWKYDADVLLTELLGLLFSGLNSGGSGNGSLPQQPLYPCRDWAISSQVVMSTQDIRRIGHHR
jgi:hypothetical protein